jgi:uncharacterized RDD family membrane protein YckC
MSGVGGRGEHSRVGGVVRRAVGEALDATVGRVGERVGETARELSEATARQVVDELEPYLIAETVPRIVAGITPFLVTTTGPELVDGLTEHLTEVPVPAIVAELSDQLATETIPAIMATATPTLVEATLPALLDALRPHLVEELVPRILDGLMPYINDVLAPAVMAGLMPEIRYQVVPQILDDIIDDPKVRDLIREQSQGLLFDAVERLRSGAAHADDVVEGFARRLARRPARTSSECADTPAPVGRSFAIAGVVSRSVASGIDLAMVSWLVGSGISAIVGILNSFLDPVPSWLLAGLSLIGATLAPVYFALSWWLAGRTVAEFMIGLKVTRFDGTKPGPVRAFVRAWLGLPLLFVWVVGLISTFTSPRRHAWLDWASRTEVRYTVHSESAAQRAAARAREAAEALANQ